MVCINTPHFQGCFPSESIREEHLPLKCIKVDNMTSRLTVNKSENMIFIQMFVR